MLNWFKKKLGITELSSNLHELKDYTDESFCNINKKVEIFYRQANNKLLNQEEVSKSLLKRFNSLSEQTEKMTTIGVNIEDFKGYGCNWGVILINNPNNQRVEMFNIKNRQILDQMYEMLKYSNSIINAPRSVKSIIHKFKQY